MPLRHPPQGSSGKGDVPLEPTHFNSPWWERAVPMAVLFINAVASHLIAIMLVLYWLLSRGGSQ